MADKQPTKQKARAIQSPAFRVLVTCGVFEPGFRGGGPIQSVARIIDTAPRTVDVTLVTRDRDLGAAEPYTGLSGRFSDRSRNRVFYLNTGNWRQWGRLWQELRSTPFDLLYTNSLWSPQFTLIPIIAMRLGLINVRALAIAPRGELSPGALSLKPKKKRLFLRWCERLIVTNAIWHASAEKEAGEIALVFPTANIIINSDQISLPLEALETTINLGIVRLVFIGRISRKKNIELALKALAKIAGPVEFDIYGPIEDLAYWKRCKLLMNDLPITVRARYCGELAHVEVPKTFAQYDAFIFPTLGENFGHVIVESLSAGCPVVCSDHTPWTGTLETGGGRVVHNFTVEGWAAELERLATLSPQDRLRARRMAADAYLTWSRGAVSGNFLESIRLHLAQ